MPAGFSGWKSWPIDVISGYRAHEKGPLKAGLKSDDAGMTGYFFAAQLPPQPLRILRMGSSGSTRDGS
jgi:hypothetical protein